MKKFVIVFLLAWGSLYAQRHPSEEAYKAGLAAIEMGAWMKAENEFSRAIDLGFKPAKQVYLKRAEVRYERGLLIDAYNDLVEALKEEPEMREAIRLRGLIAYENGHFQEALEDFNWCLDRNPNDEEVIQKRRVAEKEVAVLTPQPGDQPPVISWTETPDSYHSGDKEIKVTAQVASSSEVHFVQFFHNGRILNKVGQMPITGGMEYWAFITLDEGDNTIYLEAVNTFGRSTSEPVRVSFGTEKNLVRKDRALLIAIEQYQHNDKWKKLNNPLLDAKALALVLESKFDFETELLENPTEEQLLRKLREYAKIGYGQDDQLLIFFSGHGNNDELLGRGQFVLSDSYDELSCMSHIDFLDQVDRISCEHILVLADACFSGMMESLNLGEKDKREPSRGSHFYKSKSDEEFLVGELSKRSRKFLASGSEEVPDGPPGNHTPFMYKVLEALEGDLGNDGFLEFAELVIWVNKIGGSSPVDGNFGRNQPGSNFIFVGK